MGKLYLIGFHSVDDSHLHSVFRGFGLRAESRELGGDLSGLRGAIVIPSSISFGSREVFEQFVSYVRDSGNGLAIIFVFKCPDAADPLHPSTEITPLLQTFGLSLTGITVYEDCTPVPVCPDYEGVRDCNLVSLLRKMWELFDAPRYCSIEALQWVLENLLCHIMCLEGDLVDQLPNVCARVFGHLQRTNCVSGDLLPFPGHPVADCGLVGNRLLKTEAGNGDTAARVGNFPGCLHVREVGF
jgi:hypothetical protein